jgi:hypothetical protein
VLFINKVGGQICLSFHALPASLLSEMATQLPIFFRENDSLDDFLDCMLLRAYEQLRKQTGSHSKAAHLRARQSFPLSAH